MAALQLTNLYKQGLQNTKSAFHDGYAQALRDTVEIISGLSTGQGPSAPADAQSRLDSLSAYLKRRLEALHTDAQDTEEFEARTPSASQATPRGARQRLAERREHARHSAPLPARAASTAATPITPLRDEKHTNRARDARCDVDSDAELDTPVARRERPRKRRRARALSLPRGATDL